MSGVAGGKKCRFLLSCSPTWLEPWIRIFCLSPRWQFLLNAQDSYSLLPLSSCPLPPTLAQYSVPNMNRLLFRSFLLVLLRLFHHVILPHCCKPLWCLVNNSLLKVLTVKAYSDDFLFHSKADLGCIQF